VRVVSVDFLGCARDHPSISARRTTVKRTVKGNRGRTDEEEK
jgi:hypothetical protein